MKRTHWAGRALLHFKTNPIHVLYIADSAFSSVEFSSHFKESLLSSRRSYFNLTNEMLKM
jgi:hypothetical protein